MSNPCQQCGRPATYRHPVQAFERRFGIAKGHRLSKNKRCGRKDHDLCERCWRKLMDAQRAQEAA